MLSHVELAASLADELGLHDDVAHSLRHAYERWDGKGWPNKVAGEAIAMPSRIAQLAEFMEVANRGGGVEGATAMARDRRGTQFDPALVDLLCGEARGDPRRPRRGPDLGRRDRRRAGPHDRSQRRSRRRRARGGRELRRVEVGLLARALARSGRPRRRRGSRPRFRRRDRGDASPCRPRSRPRPPRRLERDLGETRAARRRRVGARAHASVPHRAHAPVVAVARAAGGDRRAALRAHGRLGIPARALGCRHFAAGPRARGGGRVPGDARAAAPSRGAVGRRPRRPSCGPTSRPAASTPRPPTPSSAPRAIACGGGERAPPASPAARLTCWCSSRAASRTRRLRSGS